MPKPASYVEDTVEAMSIKYNNLVYDMKTKGEDVIVLSLGEAFFDIPLYPFDDLPFPAIYHYSHSRGIPELRQKLADYYQEEYNVPVDPETEIIVTAGSKIAIHMALMAVLNPGDEVIIHEPAWVSYSEQVRLCHGLPVMVPHDKTTGQLGEYVTERTKAIIINNPNNPRGLVLSLEEVSELYELVKRHDIYLLLDEAYSDFLLDDETFVSAGRIDQAKEHVIICNSMSKNYGMSGWRIGYVITNRELIYQILKVNQHLITCPSTILEYYLAKHFNDILTVTKPQIQEVLLKRKTVTEYIDDLGLKYLKGTSTFYIFVSIEDSILKSEEFCTKLLIDHKVSAVPGIGYGESCDKFIRLSVGAENMERTLHGVRMIQETIIQTTEQAQPEILQQN